MKILGSWLQEFHSLDGDLEALRRTLTGAGIEVAELTPVEPDDFDLEIELTANRPDLLSHFGLARELAAIEGGDLVAPDLGEDPGVGGTFPIAVESDRCGRYAGLVVEDVTVGPSPDWLRERLERMGLRPISNVVDITNYVLFELNHPLHAFDLDKLSGGISARQARAGEMIALLDGSRKALVEDDLVITDASGPVALAGVMGGVATSVTAGTRRLLLEAAWFQPASVRRTARRHGLATDSSYRFERGADPEAVFAALRRTAALLGQCAGGRIVGGFTDVRGALPQRRAIAFRPSRVARVLGVVIPEAVELLGKLGCRVSGEGERLDVEAPSWRGDIEREIDLVEEVARLAGYDRLPSTLPALPGRTGDFDAGVLARLAQGALPAAYAESVGPATGRVASLSAGQAAVLSAASEDFRWMRRTLAETMRLQGFDACMHFSFAPPDFGEIPLANPIHAEHSTMRATLVPALLNSARSRLHRAGSRHALLFELDKAFRREPSGAPGEAWTLAGVACGIAEDRRYDGRSTDAVVADHLLGCIHALGKALGASVSLRSGAFASPWHERLFQDAAILEVAGVIVGTCGEVAPGGIRDADLGPVFGFEIDCGALWHALAPVRRPSPYRPLPRFPSATRDLAFLVDEGLVVGEVLEAARSAAPEHLVSIELFDVFVFSGKGRKSVGIRLVLRAADRTLTEAEIATAVEAVTARVTGDCQAVLRTQ